MTDLSMMANLYEEGRSSAVLNCIEVIYEVKGQELRDKFILLMLEIGYSPDDADYWANFHKL